MRAITAILLVNLFVSGAAVEVTPTNDATASEASASDQFQQAVLADEINHAESAISASPLLLAQSCVCYCGGSNFGPGSSACMGGQKMICSDRPPGSGRNCGWAPPAVQGTPIPCSGSC